MRDDERKGIESYQLELRSVLTKLKTEGMTGGDLTSKKAEYEASKASFADQSKRSEAAAAHIRSEFSIVKQALDKLPESGKELMAATKSYQVALIEQNLILCREYLAVKSADELTDERYRQVKLSELKENQQELDSSNFTTELNSYIATFTQIANTGLKEESFDKMRDNQLAAFELAESAIAMSSFTKGTEELSSCQGKLDVAVDKFTQSNSDMKSLSEQTIQAQLNSKSKELTELESKKKSSSLFNKGNSAVIISLKAEIQAIEQVLETAKGLSSLNQVTKSVLTEGEPIITKDKLRIVTQSSSPNLDGENLKTEQNAKILTDLISQKLTESKVILQKATEGQQLSSARDPSGLGGQAYQVASISVNALSAEFLGKIPGLTLAKEVGKAAKVEVDTQLAKKKYSAIEGKSDDLAGFAAKFCDSLKYSDAEKPSILATLNEADLVKIAEESVGRIYTHIDSKTERSLEEMVATKKTAISKAQDPTAVGTHLSVDSTRTVEETRTVDGLLSRGGVIVDGVKYVHDKKGADKYGFRVSDKIPRGYLKEQDYKISHGQLKPSDLLERAATQEERNEHDKQAYSAKMSQARTIMQGCLKEGSKINDFLDDSSQAKLQLKDKTKSTLFSKKLTEYQTAKAKLAEINAEPELARKSEVGERQFADPGKEAPQKPESLAQVVKNLFKKESPAQQQPAEQQQVEQQPAEQQPSRKFGQMFKSAVSKIINKEARSQEVGLDKVYPENGSVGIENPMLQSNGGAKFEPERSSLSSGGSSDRGDSIEPERNSFSSGASSDRSLSQKRLSEILGGENVGDLSKASVTQQQGGAIQVGNAGIAQNTAGVER